MPNSYIPGRTGRAGNTGIATSFYNEHDSDLAEVLTKTLMETGQEVPDFLTEYKPEEGVDLKFEADSDFGDEENGDSVGDAGGGAWGAPAKPAPIPANAGGVWGVPAEVASTPSNASGWGVSDPVAPVVPAGSDAWGVAPATSSNGW